MGDVQGFSALEMIGMAYLVLAIAKSILCLSNVGVAAGVMKRKLGNYSMLSYVALASVLTVAVVFVRLPVSLYTERLRFFLVYTDRKVMRDILSGF
jgi:hypothetical protein